MGRTDTEEYSNWEQGYSQALEHIIELIKEEMKKDIPNLEKVGMVKIKLLIQKEIADL